MKNFVKLRNLFQGITKHCIINKSIKTNIVQIYIYIYIHHTIENTKQSVFNVRITNIHFKYDTHENIISRSDSNIIGFRN